MGKPKFNEKQKAEIVRLHEAGVTAAEIARRFDAGGASVGRTLRQAGVPSKTQYIVNQKVGYEHNAAIAEARKNGASLANLAKKYGLSEAMVINRLRMEGIQPGEYRPPKGPPDDKYIEMYNAGMSLSKIGREYNVGHHTIAKWLEVAGARERRTKEVSEEVREKLRRTLTRKQVKEIINLYNNYDKSAEEIEFIMNCSHSTVSRVLKRNGIPMRKPGEGTSTRGQKIAAAHLGQKRTTETREKMSKAMTESMKAGRNRISQFEKDVAKILDDLGILYNQQFSVKGTLEGRKRWFSADFKLNENILLECFGTFYHCDPRKYPDGPVSGLQAVHSERDVDRLKAYREAGYECIVLWEQDFKDEGIEAVKKVLGGVMPQIVAT